MSTEAAPEREAAGGNPAPRLAIALCLLLACGYAGYRVGYSAGSTREDAYIPQLRNALDQSRRCAAELRRLTERATP